MPRLAVIGTGYVGLTTGACFAELGHDVVGVDIDPERIGALRRGEPVLYEPGLPELTVRNVAAGRLRFTTNYQEAIPTAEFVVIAVGTPMKRRGEPDLVFVRQAAKAIAHNMRQTLTIVNKSTVPIGTGDVVSRIVAENLKKHIPFQVVSNPEFLREGTAIQDFMHPDRLVFGAHDRLAAERVSTLYSGIAAPTVFTDLYTAEMIKYASNAFLATRISFINEIARICERVGADAKLVAKGMGLDHRIGPAFLEAGVGYGGSCFPKDVKALSRMAEAMGYHPELLNAVMEINSDQRKLVVDKVGEVLGSFRDQVVGVLGVSFKPNTDDIREAPSVEVIGDLLRRGAEVRVYDPVAMPPLQLQMNGTVTYCQDAYGLSTGADALLLITEWDEFRHLDFDRVRSLMRRPVIIDGRNIYDPAEMRTRGFVYRGIGRS